MQFYTTLCNKFGLAHFFLQKCSIWKHIFAGFDISPDDEVKFESSVSKEEVDEAVKKNTPGTYIPLVGNANAEQIESFLKGAGDETLAARIKHGKQTAIRKKIEAEMTEDERLNEQE